MGVPTVIRCLGTGFALWNNPAIFLATSKKQLVTSMSRASSSWCSCNREFIGTEFRPKKHNNNWLVVDLPLWKIWAGRDDPNYQQQSTFARHFLDSFVTQRRIPHGHGLDLSFQWPESCPCWIILPELEIVQILIEKNMFCGHTSLHSWPKKPSTYPSPFSSYGANTKYLVDHLPFLVSHNSARLGTTLPRYWISRPLVDLGLSLNDYRNHRSPHEILKKQKGYAAAPFSDTPMHYYIPALAGYFSHFCWLSPSLLLIDNPVW